MSNAGQAGLLCRLPACCRLYCEAHTLSIQYIAAPTPGLRACQAHCRHWARATALPFLGSPFSVELPGVPGSPHVPVSTPFHAWPVQRTELLHRISSPQPQSGFQLQHQSITITRLPPFIDCDRTKSVPEKTRATSRYLEQSVELDCLGALQPTIHLVQVETESRGKRPPSHHHHRETDRQPASQAAHHV